LAEAGADGVLPILARFWVFRCPPGRRTFSTSIVRFAVRAATAQSPRICDASPAWLARLPREEVRLPALRIDDIVSSFERERSLTAAAVARESDRRICQERFRQYWHKVYPVATEFTGPALETVVRRLLRLGRFVRVRLWDFAIAERLTAEQDFYAAVAVRLLAHACARNPAQLRFCLGRSRTLFPTVARRHEELFDEIELAMSTGLRPTPALSQAEMARVLDVSYDTFRGDVRAGRWQSVAQDAIRNKRQRRWRHASPNEHAAALKRIRRRLPKRLWADLPFETYEALTRAADIEL
jgi:hypothetical protein